MRWFKHETEAYFNPKIQLLVSKFGIEAYGFYFLLVEFAGKELHADMDVDEIGRLPDFVDMEYLSMVTGISPDRLQLMVDVMVQLGLIEIDDERIKIPKIVKRIDVYTYRKLLKKRAGSKGDSMERRGGKQNDKFFIPQAVKKDLLKLLLSKGYSKKSLRSKADIEALKAIWEKENGDWLSVLSKLDSIPDLSDLGRVNRDWYRLTGGNGRRLTSKPDFKSELINP